MMRDWQRFIRWTSEAVLAWMILCSVPAFAQKDPIGQPDTCRIVVIQDQKSNQAVANVSIFNDEELAAMTLTFRYGNGQSPVRCDSIRFWDTRCQFFEMKTGRVDSINQTILIGLIADMSGNNPPMEKGDGEVTRIYFTLPQGEKFQDFVMDTTWIRPFNVLKFVTPEIEGIYPAFDNSKAMIKGGIPIPSPEKTKDDDKEGKPTESEPEREKQSEG
jgi:hypothetical protein